MASYANDGHANSVESAKTTWGDVEQPSTEHVGEPVSTGLLHVVTLTDLHLNPNLVIMSTW